MWGLRRVSLVLLSYLLLATSLKSNETHQFSYEKVRGLILVQASLNDEAEKPFILDTGSDEIILHSKNYLEPAHKSDFITITGEVQTQSATTPSIRINDLILRNREVFLGDLSALHHFLNREIAGILGLGVFDNKSIFFDLQNQTITIGEKGKTINYNGTVTFPLNKLNGLPVLQLSINSVNTNFVLDSGCSAHVMDDSFASAHFSSDQSLQSVRLIGLAADKNSETQKMINSFFLNELSDKQTKLLLRDLSHINKYFDVPISGLLSPQMLDVRFVYMDFSKKEAVFGLKFPRLTDIALN